MRLEGETAGAKRPNTGPGGNGSGRPAGQQAPRHGREVDGSVLKPIELGTADPRPVLLFEVSGVLCNSTSARMATSAKNFLPRAGLRHLARLLPKFRLGIYTSAQERSVVTALGVVTSSLRGELVTWPDGWQMLIDGKPEKRGEGGDDGVRPHCLYLPRSRFCACPRVGGVYLS